MVTIAGIQHFQFFTHTANVSVMQFYSTRNIHNKVNLKQAVLEGLAGDGGLYMPEKFPQPGKDFIEHLPRKGLHEMAFAVLSGFLEEVPPSTLAQMVEETLHFKMPLVTLEEDIFSMELFHGPTMAFKDVGARFMARLMAWLLRNNNRNLKVVTATSGDTGSAVAAGFLKVPGIEVYVFFPRGKVSELQQKQITTQGENIKAIEIDGSFDDCQALVKAILSDKALNKKYMITSANSINIARLLPQSVYYFHAASQIKAGKPLVFSVPSGNFGNLTAGLMAQQMGLPVKRFIAATNVNDVVPAYYTTSRFTPRPSVATLSNAMDVGNPSNFDRISRMMEGSHAAFCNRVYACSFSDEQTRQAVQSVLRNHDYLMDPHGAIAWLGAREYHQKEERDTSIVFLETAHPAKFPETLKVYREKYSTLPLQLEKVRQKQETFTSLPYNYEVVRDWLEASSD